jgi:putative ABC transport system ATP-binding protein
MKNIIELDHITKVYRNGTVETPVLQDVSFTVTEGDFVAIMGPSGSGKSTLMNILGALDIPTQGTYRLAGQDVSQLSEDELAEIRQKKIGFVFQSFHLLPRATVLRNVLLPLVYSSIATDKRERYAHTALEAAGLPRDRWDHLSNQLSGGQMQRVAIARALVARPAIILADEPTGNLDTKTGEFVLKTFQELNHRDHHTIILITHEPYIAEHANRIIRVQDGMILEDKVNTKKRVIHHNLPS